MLKRLAFLAVLTAATFCEIGQAAAEDVRVLSWNLQWFPGRKPDAPADAKAAQITAVQRAIAEMRPDIVCLQEVRDARSAQLALAKVPDLKVCVFSKFKGEQQVALATRYPVDSGWSETWARVGADDPPRGYSFAAISLPGRDKRLLMIYGVHFKANTGDESPEKRAGNIAKRENAAAQLLAHIREIRPDYEKRAKLSWVLSGDFNTSLEDPRFASEHTLRALMAAKFQWVFEGIPAAKRYTLPESRRYPAVTFDHQLFQGLELVSVEVPTKYTAASDHRPVLAVYRVPSK